MSKPKAFLKHGKPKKSKEQVLETVDDFQAAGVDFEEAAGKWRAGDAIKSLRFFGRAIEVYDQGLQKFPSSLDLAYNKARVQLEIATHPVLTDHLQVPVLNALEQALLSHRYAINIDPDNADSLFNTSQVLTAIAEVFGKDPTRSDQDALQMLEEALELQARCMSIQELNFEEAQQQRAALVQQAESNSPDNITESPQTTATTSEQNSKGEAEDQWFSVVEPITTDTLIDTALSQLSTLTTLCSILSSNLTTVPLSTLSWVEEYSSKLLTSKLPLHAQTSSPERLQEIALTKAIFASSLLDAGYRASQVSAQTYKRERDAVFSTPELQLQTTSDALLANAQSLINLNSALADHNSFSSSSSPSTTSPIPTNSQPEEPSSITIQWTSLISALSNLTTASKLPSTVPQDISKTHFLRGDVSLLQAQLGLPPASYQQAITNRVQLLKNAEVYYRNAGKLVLAGGDTAGSGGGGGGGGQREQKAVAKLREGVAVALQKVSTAGSSNSMGLSGGGGGGGVSLDVTMMIERELSQLSHELGQDWVKNQVGEMIDDGLLSL